MTAVVYYSRPESISDWLEIAARYFSAFFSPSRAVVPRLRGEGCFASARRSVFFRRFARFLALSLPLLCPIIPNTLPLTSNLKHQKFFRDSRTRAVSLAMP